MLYRSTDRLSRRGAPVKHLAHSVSFDSCNKNAPSKCGTKHPNTQPGEARESRLAHASLISACERLSSMKSAATRGLSRTRSQILIGAFSLPSGAVPPESQRFLAARFRRPGSRGIALFLGILANDRAEHDMPASSLAER